MDLFYALLLLFIMGYMCYLLVKRIRALEAWQQSIMDCLNSCDPDPDGE